MKIAAALFLLFAFVASPIRAATSPDPVLEARAVRLGDEIRCVVCQSETINDSEADAARDLRKLVRAKIDAGWSDVEIRDYLRTRYGDFILLKPPLQPNTYLLWFCPLIFLAVGAGLAGMFLWRKFPRPSRDPV